MALDPVTTSALIQGGTKILGGLIGGKQSNLSKHLAAEQLHMARRQEAWQRTMDTEGVRIRARDARKAGLHPYFALGGGVNASSPATYVPGFQDTGFTGSHAGDAISGVGEALGDWVERKYKPTDPNDALRTRLLKAQVKEAEAHAEKAHNDNKRVTQAANHHRSSDPDLPADGVQIFPWKDAPRLPPLEKLPIRVHPRERFPNKVQAHGKNGDDYYPYAPPGLGGDEINQVIWLINRSIEEIGKRVHPGKTRRAPPRKRRYRPRKGDS